LFEYSRKKVLDLSRLLPGPYCTMLLGDLGMEVMKIEDTNMAMRLESRPHCSTFLIEIRNRLPLI
jgi:crotonobetainyl-CoA:carnitine CoA-transferase CaiB-like acyl-CoA transferase